MSTALEIRTTSFTPAKVEFNFDQLSSILDETLQKYAGLEFTEKEVGECKKTMAELRKGKTMLDTYRKETKKLLTESVTAFEERCKELQAKFDAVIDPLSEQYEQFEHNRRERKRREIDTIIDELVAAQGLKEPFVSQLRNVPEDYYNKGKDLKTIKVELSTRAQSLGIAQDKENADREIIKTKVELANAKAGVNLVETPYVRLLGVESIEAIVEKINADAEELKRRESVSKAVDIPPAFTPKADAERFVETYEVTGTVVQLDALEQYMKEHGYEFTVLD